MLKAGMDSLTFSFDEDNIKIVQIKGSGSSARVIKVFSQDLKGLDENEMVKGLQNAFSGFNVASSNVAYVISPSMTTTKNIEIPSTNPEEINSIVSLQAGRHTPFSREEIQIGYVTIGVYKNNYTKVLLVIANANAIKKQLSLFERAGVKVKRVLFSPEGIAAFYTFALDLKNDTAPKGFIDIGQNSSNFIIAFQGKPIASRNIPVGRSHLTQDEAGSQERLADELAKTISAYQGEDIGAAPGSYHLSVNDATTQKLQAYLQAKLKWEFKVSPYIDFIKANNDVLEILAKTYADKSFLDVIVNGASSDESQVDLMPTEVQLQKSIEIQGRELFKAGILVMVIVLLIVGILVSRFGFSQAYLSKLKNKYQGNRNEVSNLENQKEAILVIQNYFKNRMVSLEAINELYQRVPNEIYLTNIAMDEEGTITIQGISDVHSMIYNLVTSLKESKYFKSAEAKSTTAKKDRGKDVSAFEIIVKLKTMKESEKSEKTPDVAKGKKEG